MAVDTFELIMASHRCLPFPWKQWFHTTSRGDAPPPAPLPPTSFSSYSVASQGHTLGAQAGWEIKGKNRVKRLRFVMIYSTGRSFQVRGKTTSQCAWRAALWTCIHIWTPLWCTTVCRFIATLHVCLTRKCTCLFSSMPQHHTPREAMGGSPHATSCAMQRTLSSGWWTAAVSGLQLPITAHNT